MTWEDRATTLPARKGKRVHVFTGILLRLMYLRDEAELRKMSKLTKASAVRMSSSEKENEFSPLL